MRKKIYAALVAALLLCSSVVYADPVETLLPHRNYGEDGAPIKGITLTNTDRATKFVAHANGVTYLTYAGVSALTKEEYFYLGIVNKEGVTEIGDIDSLTGEYSTNLNYWVTGMVQCKGEIFLSKPNGLYKLQKDKLVRMKLTVDGKTFDLNGKYKMYIGGLSTDGEKLYIHLRVPMIVNTAEKDNVFKTPLDSAILSVTADGKVDDTGYHMQKHYPNKSPSFAVMNDKLFCVLSDMLPLGRTNVLGIHIKGEDMRKHLYFNVGDLSPVDARVISYKGRIFSFTHPYYQDYVTISEITQGEFYRTRKTRDTAGIYDATSEEIARIDGIHYIAAWSVGDDGYLYIVGESGSESNIAIRAGYSVHRLKL